MSRTLIVGLFLLLAGGFVWANNEAELTSDAYFNLQPALIGNYNSGDGRLKFYKADISLRVRNANLARVEYHQPLIRDQLVLLFSAKTGEDFASVQGKDAVRMAALQRVQSVLTQEEGEPLVSDLLFNNLVIQH